MKAAFTTIIFVGTLLARAFGAQPATPAALEAIKLTDNIYVLVGGPSNITVQTGKDGTIVVDAGTRERAAEALKIIGQLSNQPIRYIINTSADPDHIGGNAVLAKAGRSIFFTGPTPISSAGGLSVGLGATVFAPIAVLSRLAAPDSKVPMELWPTEAFIGSRRYVYFNHEGIEIFPGPAHDDTDSIVHFRGSDVICAGDAIDTTRFPRIDISRGGSIQGEIETLNRILQRTVRPIPFVYEKGGTYIVPGHGRVYQQADLVDYRDMMVIIRDIVQDMIGQGMTLQQIQAARPVKAYETQYGAESGPWTTHDFVKAVFDSLQAPVDSRPPQ